LNEITVSFSVFSAPKRLLATEFSKPGLRGERGRIGGNKPVTGRQFVIRKEKVGAFWSRIDDLASVTTKGNFDADHESLSTYSAREPLSPGLTPLDLFIVYGVPKEHEQLRWKKIKKPGVLEDCPGHFLFLNISLMGRSSSLGTPRPYGSCATTTAKSNSKFEYRNPRR